MRPRVCLLTMSWVADDPRVRKHGDSLAEAGYDVVAVGFRGARSAPPSWPVVELEPPEPQSLRRKLRRAAPAVPARVLPALGVGSWWLSLENRRFWSAARAVSADLYVAHDWPVLPVAARLAAAAGTRYAYDSREYGVEEFAHAWKWRVLFPPHVSAVERRFVPGAAAVYTVGDGIAALLQRDLGLARRPAVVRNIPPVGPLPAAAGHEVGDPIRLLYHGQLGPGRGLEELLSSVPSWRPGRVLTVRGIGTPAYLGSLAGLVEREGIGDRVTLVPPVLAAELVAAAATSDVGVVTYTGSTEQLRNALPNKFFEYTAAGLCLLVTDMPEMARLVGRYDMGVLAGGGSPAELAAAVNALDAASVERYRANARIAAEALTWEREKQRLLDVIGSALA